MNDDELLRHVENGVLWLTINRADKANAIPYYVRDALTEAFRKRLSPHTRDRIAS